MMVSIYILIMCMPGFILSKRMYPSRAQVPNPIQAQHFLQPQTYHPQGQTYRSPLLHAPRPPTPRPHRGDPSRTQAPNPIQVQHFLQPQSYHPQGQTYRSPLLHAPQTPAPQPHMGATPSYDDFCQKYKKRYKSEEDRVLRHGIYDKNCEEIREHNKLYEKGQKSFTMGVNEHSDLTPLEFLKYLTGDIIGHITGDRQHLYSFYVPNNTVNEPESMDYRKLGAINPIRNQRPCGSCYAFSAISSIESQIFIIENKLLKLSEQYLIDCSKGVAFYNTPNHTGCDGGTKSGVYEYAHTNGIVLLDDYPFTGREGTCKQDAPKTAYRVKEIIEVQSGSDNDLKNALVHKGPIAVSVYVSEIFRNYKEKGIFEDELCDGKKNTNHAVLLVGYGSENGIAYWLIRNSWGESWGDKGYMKLSRVRFNHCLISSKPYIPVIERTDSTK